MRITIVAVVRSEQRLDRNESNPGAFSHVGRNMVTRMVLVRALHDVQLTVLANDDAAMPELGLRKNERRENIDLERLEQTVASGLVKENDVAGPRTIADVLEWNDRAVLVPQLPS